MSKKLFLDRLSKLPEDDEYELFTHVSKALEEMEAYQEKKLAELYRRVDGELCRQAEAYFICGAVTRADEALLFRSFLQPIPGTPDASSLYTGFFALDEDCLVELEGQVFPAVLQTAEGQRTISVRAVRSRQYTGQIEKLRMEFLNNGLPWNHVHLPGLYQFFEFHPCEELVEETETLLSLDLGPWRDVKQDNMVALWNLERVSVPCAALPTPVLDSIHYEHQLYLEDQSCGYLAADSPFVKFVTLTPESLVVTSQQEDAALWEAVKITPVPAQTLLPEHFCLTTNARRLTHTDKQAAFALRSIQTRAHILRLLTSYAAADNFTVLGMESRPSPTGDVGAIGAQRVNGFIPEEFPRRQWMLFHLRIKRPSLYPRFAVSFLMAELENALPQYRCAATLEPLSGREGS